MNPISIPYAVLALLIGAVLAVVGVIAVKDKGKRKMFGWIGGIVVAVGILMYFGGVTSGIALGGAGGISTFSVAGVPTYNVNTDVNPNPTQVGTPGQNPSVGLVFTDALTQQSITAGAINYKDATTGKLLGASPTFVQGQTVTLLANASGYITEVQPNYPVISGAQQIQGSLYKFANETIQIYSNAGTSTIGNAVLGVGNNDTAFTTQANNKILLTGNTFKSSGRLFLVYEVSTTQNVSAVTLTQTGSTTPIASITVPNCYTPTLTGSPYKVAFELPAIVGGNQVSYNLQTVSANGNTVQGASYLTIYNEQDAVDSLNGAILTSGICDSNNVATSISSQTLSWYYN